MIQAKVHHPGEVLGNRYKITRLIGFGGMGVVYLSDDVKLGTTVALKMLRSPADYVNIERLRQEILLARKVTHENVCRVHDLGEIGGEEFISMEFLEGRSVKDVLIKEGPFAIGRGLKIARQILLGLEAAHKTGIVHCDLKPENIFLCAEDLVKIMDFGISRAKNQPIEKDAPIMGTPEFLAPEQIRNDPVDGRTDLYALGIILYEMFTGVVPYEHEDVYTLLDKVLYDPPPRPIAHRADLPEGLEAIILKSIAKEPADRYAGAKAFLDAVDRFEGNLVDQMLRDLSVARQKMVRLMVVLEAQRAISSAMDLDGLLETILQVTTREAGADRGTIFLIDRRKQVLWSRVLEGDKKIRIELPLGKGIAGEVARSGETLNIPDAYKDGRFNPEVDKSSGYTTRSLLCVPMRSYAGDIVGVIELLNKKAGPFTQEDEDFLREVCAHAATLLEQAQVQEERILQAQLKKEMSLASLLQQKLFPGPDHRVEGLEIAWHRFGEGVIGGNYFDLIQVDERKTTLMLADTSQPGLGSSLLASNFQGAFRLLVEESESPLGMIMKLNGHIHRSSLEQLFISCVTGTFDLARGVFSYVNAGHPAALRISRQGTVQFLSATGIALGVEHDYPYSDVDLPVEKVDLFCFFTPGIVETEDRLGRFYEVDRLQKLFVEGRSKPLDALLEAFVRSWEGFLGDQELPKDATLALVRIL
jgi:serine phosphatase RsbU (regulator of sigma subunit)/predicted Ser/Thr protein kinase